MNRCEKESMREHVERMTDDRLAKIVKENGPQATRSRGGPKKDGKMSQQEVQVFILFFLIGRTDESL